MSSTRILTVVLGSAALATLVSVTPVAAQGVPAGLLRLDSAQTSFGDAQLSEAQQAKVRSSYNHVRTKRHVEPQQ